MSTENHQKVFFFSNILSFFLPRPLDFSFSGQREYATKITKLADLLRTVSFLASTYFVPRPEDAPRYVL